MALMFGMATIVKSREAVNRNVRFSSFTRQRNRSLTQISVLFLAESSASAKTQIVFRQIRIVVAVFHSFISVHFVGKSDEAVIISVEQYDVEQHEPILTKQRFHYPRSLK